MKLLIEGEEKDEKQVVFKLIRDNDGDIQLCANGVGLLYVDESTVGALRLIRLHIYSEDRDKSGFALTADQTVVVA